MKKKIKNKRYYIDYGTAAEGETTETIEEAMEIVDKYMSYTGESIEIKKEDNGETVAIRRWNKINLDYEKEFYEPEELEKCIKFGTWGYYSPWLIMEDI